jgi:hypothetical protein
MQGGETLQTTVMDTGAGLVYELWAPFERTLHVSPASSILLFVPPQQVVAVGAAVSGSGGLSAWSIQPFTAELGVFIHGAVSPPLAGVHVTLSPPADDSAAAAPAVSVTGADGKYRAGPFRSTEGYTAVAVKPGYSLVPTPLDPFQFDAHTLNAISVNVVLANSKVRENSVQVAISSLDRRPSAAG